MELIDRKAFDSRVRAAVGFSEEELTDDFKDGILVVLDMMKTAPTIEAVPKEQYQRMVQTVANLTEKVSELIKAKPKSGRWIETNESDPCYYQCSECGRRSDMLDNYCPNCGADMREVKK